MVRRSFEEDFEKDDLINFAVWRENVTGKRAPLASRMAHLQYPECLSLALRSKRLHDVVTRSTKESHRRSDSHVLRCVVFPRRDACV